MNIITIIIVFSGGLFCGFIAGITLKFFNSKKYELTAKELAAQIIEENESKRTAEKEILFERMKDSFGNLSMEALRASSDQFLKLAKDKFDSERQLQSMDIESKKKLIDSQLEKMGTDLEKISRMVNDFEKDREQKFGALERSILETNKNTAELTKSTSSLREALASTKQRGQWGERMAEDVLRMAGFVENVNYIKQKVIGSTGEKPDFSFILPKNRVLNMDVKFPFDNYLKSIEAQNETDRDRFRKVFLKDVRARILEITTRAYINPEENTVDYVLLFIPNEHIYSFIHEQDSMIMDESIGKKVILCSPITLFAVLAVIRAAMDNFILEQKSHLIIKLMGQFKNQWDKFSDALEKMGNHIKAVQTDYINLVTTRKNQLEKPLFQIEQLRIDSAEEPDEGFKKIEENL